MSNLSPPASTVGPAWLPAAGSVSQADAHAAGADSASGWLDPFAAGAFDTLHISPGGAPRPLADVERDFLAALGVARP
jgi:hypothetical protein